MPQAESNAMPEGCDSIITPEEEGLYTEEQKAELEGLKELMSAPAELPKQDPLATDPTWYQEQLDRIERKCDQALGVSTQILAAARILLEQVKAIAEAEPEED